MSSRLAPELQAIVALCGDPISVAEISARTRMHFGVTRVLVGDLRAAGHLDVHVGDAEDALDPGVILRVIDGLRDALLVVLDRALHRAIRERGS